MRKIILVVLLALPILCCANSALAQSQIEGLSHRIPLGYWATTGRALKIVTTTEPTVLKRCTFFSIDDKQLVCRVSLNKTRTYLMSEILAIIQPAQKDPLRWLPFPFLAGCGALIYAAVVVSSIAATAGLSAAALLVIGVLGAMETGDNFTSYDELLYQKPGSTLTRSLRLRIAY